MIQTQSDIFSFVLEILGFEANAIKAMKCPECGRAPTTIFEPLPIPRSTCDYVTKCLGCYDPDAERQLVVGYGTSEAESIENWNQDVAAYIELFKDEPENMSCMPQKETFRRSKKGIKHV